MKLKEVTQKYLTEAIQIHCSDSEMFNTPTPVVKGLGIKNFS